MSETSYSNITTSIEHLNKTYAAVKEVAMDFSGATSLALREQASQSLERLRELSNELSRMQVKCGRESGTI